jgi:putative membrane protein
MRGFLGTEAPFMMDVVVVSLILVVPLLAFSISKARSGAIKCHRRLQIILSITLSIAVVLFELEMRLAGGIKSIIEAHRYTFSYRCFLWFHIFLAVSTLVLWAITFFHANKNFDGQNLLESYKPKHRILGKCSTLALLLTSTTGLVVYAWSFL